MNILRRLPLPRLLIACALLVALGAATAFAASLSSGPTPPPKPLANAVHDALAAAPVEGVSARIQLTDHLLDAASLQSQSADGGQSSTSPLLGNAAGRLWIGANGKVRVELQSESGDTQVLYDGQTLSLYDAASNTLYRMQLPQDSGQAADQSAGAPKHRIPTVEEIQNTIVHLMSHATLSGAIPSDVAGRAAYTVRISPSHDGGLVGGAELAFDAINGVPLRLALYSTASSTPVLELTATEVSYGPVADSVFDLSTPPGVTVHDLKSPTRPAGAPGHDQADLTKPAQGAAAVQTSIAFPLDAPATLAGMPRSEVRSVQFDGHAAALITYGQGLAGIAVLESQPKAGAPKQPGSASPGSGSPGSGSDSQSMATELPKVSINGSSATELGTALGTLLQFQRAGVDYTVVGSVTPAAAEAAARGL
jgi:outer membrane lipoprotein-sorting protein